MKLRGFALPLFLVTLPLSAADLRTTIVWGTKAMANLVIDYLDSSPSPESKSGR